MQAFELSEVIEKRKQAGNLYLEFLKVADLSMGVYELSSGASDPQSPHSEDEVYYVVKGKAQIRVGDEDQAVCAGSIVYVARHVEHRFHSIEENLTVLVFFAPAEYSLRDGK